mgnify:CR=1 FL=1
MQLAVEIVKTIFIKGHFEFFLYIEDFKLPTKHGRFSTHYCVQQLFGIDPPHLIVFFDYYKDRWSESRSDDFYFYRFRLSLAVTENDEEQDNYQKLYCFRNDVQSYYRVT